MTLELVCCLITGMKFIYKFSGIKNYFPRIFLWTNVFKLIRLFFWVILTTSYLAITQYIWAEELITLAAGEHVPYIGNGLPEKGYAAELVAAAFATQGYRVKIEFYPWARARQLATEGKVDGILPIFNESETGSGEQLIYSNPFPGDTIGLLKKKHFRFPIPQSR